MGLSDYIETFGYCMQQLLLQIRCVFERDRLFAEVDKLQKDFDEILMRLCHKKAHIDISMVTADTKHITYFEEMILLKEFEKRETTFTSRYKTKKKEKEAMAGKVGDTCQHLDTRLGHARQRI